MSIRSQHGGFKGFAQPHSLELDLGDLPAGAPVRLLMHGFTDYFTATSVFAAHQANVTAVLPWVEAQRPDGTWARISDDIGFPAGLLRTMTADLTGKLPAGARRIRIWTNLKIYWDQVLVDTTAEGAVPVQRTEIPLAEASLAFRGFPRELTGTPATDLQYVHGEVSKYGPYARHRGFYTKYGAVTPLLAHAEDQFVVFGAGDEVALEFDARALPPLRAGMDARLLRLLQRVREGHGLLRRPRADGGPAALQGHAGLSVPGQRGLPGPQPRIPARVEYAGSRGRELAELSVLLSRQSHNFTITKARRHERREGD